MSLTDRTPLASVHLIPMQLSTPSRRTVHGLRQGSWQGRKAWWPANRLHPDQAIISGGTLHLERARHGTRTDQADISALRIELRGHLHREGAALRLRQTDHDTALSELLSILRRHLCEATLHVVLQEQGRFTHFRVDQPSGGQPATTHSGRGTLQDLATMGEPITLHLIVGACPSQMKEVTDTLRLEWKQERNRAQRSARKQRRTQRPNVETTPGVPPHAPAPQAAMKPLI